MLESISGWQPTVKVKWRSAFSDTPEDRNRRMRVARYTGDRGLRGWVRDRLPESDVIRRCVRRSRTEEDGEGRNARGTAAARPDRVAAMDGLEKA